MARIGLLLFPIMGIFLLGFRSIASKFRKTIMIGAAISIVGIVASISIVQMAEVFPERFDLYKGDRFFSSVTLEDLENLQESKATGIYYIGNDCCSGCIEFYSVFTSLVGINKVIISHYDPLSNSELVSKQEDNLQIYGVNSIPTVLVIKRGIVTDLFDGDNIEEQVRQYF